MCEITLTFPDNMLLALKVDREQFAAEIRLAAAVKLYELGKLSSGAAAELADIPKPLFLMKLHEYNVPNFDLTEDELKHDLKNA